MTLEQFEKLNQGEQHKVVWEGSCIGYREAGEFKIIIYKVFNFYAEVYYNAENNVLTKLNAIQSLHSDIIPSINPSTLYE
ncbi:MAG: hypothetical protein ABIW34_13435 [Ginsengibacter sp.]